jgi:hypothetical protein
MYHGDDLPCIQTFEGALAWYKSREPYKKGRSKGLRPLGNNRRYDRSLINVSTDVNGNVGSVILSFHEAPVITFYPDNSIVLNNGGWETIGTMDFINSVLRVRFNQCQSAHAAYAAGEFGSGMSRWSGVTRRRGKLYFCDGSPANGEHRFERVLKLDANNEVTGGVTESEWVLDKVMMARVRKHYADFTEYLTYYAQMVGTRVAADIQIQKKLSVDKGNLRWNSRPQIRDREEFFYALNLAMLDTSEDRLRWYMPLAEQLVVNAADRQYDWAAQTYKYEIAPQKARDFFYDLCRYQYADFLFKKEVVEKGKVVLDENSKYVQYKSEATFPFAI